jgi:hypothetical protein
MRLHLGLLAACTAASVCGPGAAPAAAHGSKRAPQITYASYWGGNAGEGCSNTPAPDGSLFITCGTESTNLPRVGGIQSYQGREDGYVVKLDPSRRRILYATYLGGPGQDEIDNAAVDNAGHLYVTGFAGEGFPTTPGAFDPTFNGGSDCCDGAFGDAFVAELSADGSHLIYSTFLGGDNYEHGNQLALGHDGRVTLVGVTGSQNFPTTPGAVQPAFAGGTGTFEDVPVDAFAATLDKSGSHLIYATYLGGSGDDTGNAVSLDEAGNAYETGITQSPDFPTTPGTLKPAFGTPAPLLNAYVTKLSARGKLVWSTYLGGPTRDSGWGIAVDARRDVVVTGSTIGGFPVTPGTAQPTFGGDRDWWVAKLDRSGAALDWATYLGGSGFEPAGTTLQLDRQDRADIVGTTDSTDFPTTPDAFQPHNAGGSDVAVVQLDRDGHLVFSSYLGGSGDDDNGSSVPALDRRGNFYVPINTNSTDMFVTPDAIQPTFGGDDLDGFVARISFAPGHFYRRR